MSRVAAFVDAGYFWVQAVYVVHSRKAQRDSISVDYRQLRERLLQQVKAQFPNKDLLRIYWYDGPGAHGKTSHHSAIEDLDDFKLRLGTRNGAGDQKAVDGLIIADMIGLAQTKSISDALLLSGDADLVPGVIAGQGLGIRVHLLSMGPTNATSPFLKAEVDQKGHWDDVTVKTFATAAPFKAQVKPVSAGSSPATIVTPVAPPAGGVPAAPIGTAVVPVSFAQVAQAAVANLTQEQIKRIPKRGPIPSDIDVALLSTARRLTRRILVEAEKRQLREELRRCCFALATAPTPTPAPAASTHAPVAPPPAAAVAPAASPKKTI